MWQHVRTYNKLCNMYGNVSTTPTTTTTTTTNDNDNDQS